MQLLTYSTDPATPLNKARLELWCAKEVLAEANRTKDNEMKGRAMAYINKDRVALAKLARQLRSKLPAKKVYKVVMSGGVFELEFWERAHSRGKAMQQAANGYEGFAIEFVELVE